VRSLFLAPARARGELWVAAQRRLHLDPASARASGRASGSSAPATKSQTRPRARPLAPSPTPTPTPSPLSLARSRPIPKPPQQKTKQNQTPAAGGPGASASASTSSGDGEYVVVGDIGGTNARLSLWCCDRARGQHSEVFTRVYPVADHDQFERAYAAFQSEPEVKPHRARAAALAVAGAVANNRCQMTNTPWLIDGDALTRELGYRCVGD
jgi:hypothetical protein